MANGNGTYALVAQFRQRLVARERQATTRLTASYRRIYADLSGRAMDLREVIEAKRARGEPVSANSIRRLEQYKRLMETTQREMTRYRAVVEDEVLVGQRDAALMGVREGPEMLERALAGIPEEPRARIMATFGVLPTEAVESLVGALQEKSPLIESLSHLGEGIAEQFGDRLVLGLASGVGSRKIAADIRKELGVPLTDALRITRTALNKSHQMASLAGYRANPHIIKGWRWNAELGPRTCLSCIALHGQLFPLEEEFSDHWCGRCAPTPETVSMAELGLDIPETRPKIESGEDWFKQQPEAVQRAMMGPGKYDAWTAGQFEFGQLIRESQDPVWGRMYGEQSLINLVGGE